ncbi:hypothetical protein IV203_017903 [Nitzschia inconspicua]|uniref:Uncharacterized protein n=1 Tax=Nitzschia inconspicua TaxID=303405 RepID=A0A9K3M446_9STRA|nr:hypothetical protein IV203_017903 [Nitzschia inconspicua]
MEMIKKSEKNAAANKLLDSLHSDDDDDDDDDNNDDGNNDDDKNDRNDTADDMKKDGNSCDDETNYHPKEVVSGKGRTKSIQRTAILGTAPTTSSSSSSSSTTTATRTKRTTTSTTQKTKNGPKHDTATKMSKNQHPLTESNNKTGSNEAQQLEDGPSVTNLQRQNLYTMVGAIPVHGDSRTRTFSDDDEERQQQQQQQYRAVQEEEPIQIHATLVVEEEQETAEVAGKQTDLEGDIKDKQESSVEQPPLVKAIQVKDSGSRKPRSLRWKILVVLLTITVIGMSIAIPMLIKRANRLNDSEDDDDDDDDEEDDSKDSFSSSN